MPIPDLDAEGFLPPGIYDCTLDEIGTRFGAWQLSERRFRLFEKLRCWVEELRSIGRARAVIVNGSFVAQKPDPNDIDVVLVMPDEHDSSIELRPFEYQGLSKSRVRRRFGFDVLLASEHGPEYAEYTELFQGLRGRSDRTKGILRIIL